MKAKTEFVSKKYTMRYEIAGDEKIHSLILNYLAEDTTDDQIAKITEAVTPLVNGSMRGVLITNVQMAAINAE